MEDRLKALEAKVEKLERDAALFEEHRQAWIHLNEGIKQINDEMKKEGLKEK